MHHIAIDGGALTNTAEKQFGTYTITRELLLALGRVDHENLYTIYTMEDSSLKLPGNFTFKKISPAIGFMPYRVSLDLLIHNADCFIAINQALPLIPSVKVIALSHGLSFTKFPQLYLDSQESMRRQINTIVQKAHKILVSSRSVARSFNDIYGAEKSIEILPFGIPHDFLKTEKKYKRKKFILFVGMAHPIKNIPFIINAFKVFSQTALGASYKLILVGVGKHQLSLDQDLINKVICIPHTRDTGELRQCFAEASCVVTASLYESFNMPILEALSQDTPVVATPSAVVPELAPYVYIAQPDTTSFARQIEKAVTQPHKKTAGLSTLFNWDSYAKKLMRFYE